MKKLLLTVALAGLGGAAVAQDWSGAYVGVQSANSSYTNRYYENGVFDNLPVDGGGSMTGVFAGYNHQIGNFVLGGEIAHLSGEPAYDLFPGYVYTDMLDLKARAGYSLGRVLPYAVIGWSMTEWTNDTLTPVDADGFAYGIGAEFLVTDRVVVGLEYLQRNLVGDYFVEKPNQNIEGDFSTIAFRIAYSF
jgi:outer membrane immunogenic protein